MLDDAALGHERHGVETVPPRSGRADSRWREPVAQAVTTAWQGPSRPKRMETSPAASLISELGMKKGDTRLGPCRSCATAVAAIDGTPPDARSDQHAGPLAARHEARVVDSLLAALALARKARPGADHARRFITIYWRCGGRSVRQSTGGAHASGVSKVLMRPDWTALALVAMAAASSSANADLPRLEHKNGRHALLVDGEPFLMLGVQANNSSNYPAMLPQVWPMLERSARQHAGDPRRMGAGRAARGPVRLLLARHPASSRRASATSASFCSGSRPTRTPIRAMRPPGSR